MPRGALRISLVVVAVVGGLAACSNGGDDRATKETASLADRCAGVMRREYEVAGARAAATIGPKTFALIAPKVCALGVERGLVADDGTMSEQSGSELMTAAIEQMGSSRFQTLVFSELAVTQYDLAKPGQATRWHRCVAMGYSAFDARADTAGLPSRDVVRRAVRNLCTEGVRRGIVPPSGAPDAANPEFQRLFFTALAELQRP